MSNLIRGESKFYSAPIGGLNLYDPKIFLPETDAAVLKNFYCYPWGLKRRGGVTTAKGSGIGSTAIYSTFTFERVNGTTRDQHLIFLNNSKLFEMDLGTFTTNDITGGLVLDTTLSWQACHFNNYMILVNGTSDPIKISGGLVGSTCGFTGPGGDDKLLITVESYRQRLYFTQKDSQTFWYGNTSAISGALTSVDLSTQMNYGGNIYFICTWTIQQGFQPQEAICFVMDTGEVLVYGGTDPSSTSWALLARLKIPRPLSRRAWVKLGGVPHVATTSGIISFADALQSGSISSPFYAVTKKVNPLFSDFSTYFQPTYLGTPAVNREYVTNMAVDAVNNLVYLSLPKKIYTYMCARQSVCDLLVWNTVTGAYSLFDSVDAASIACGEGTLWFGGYSYAKIGYINPAGSGNDDDFAGGSSQACIAEVEFSPIIGMNKKRVSGMRAICSTVPGANISTQTVGMLRANFDPNAVSTSTVNTGFPLTSTKYYFAPFHGVAGIDSILSPALQFQEADSCELYALEVIFEQGGFL